MATMAFDANYYLAQYQDVREAVAAGKITAEQHWKLYGWKEERNPNAEFNTAYYAAHNTDVVTSGMNYLDHYLQYGSAEAAAGKRLPNAAWESIDLTKFDKAAYLAANQDVKAAGMDALQHYMLYGRFEASRDGTAKLTDGTVITPPEAVGQTFTLTSNIDTITGTTSNDTIIAGTQGAAQLTLNAGDTIDGNGGTDTLKIYDGQENFGSVSLKNVEVVESYDNAQTINISSNAGIQKVWLNAASTKAATAAKTQVIGFGDANGGAAAVATYTDAAGTTDTATIAVKDAGKTTAYTSIAVAGIENLTVNATGTNKLGNLIAADATNISFTGTGSVSTSLVPGTTVLKSVDASTNTGGVNVTLTDTQFGANNIAVTGGTGNDSFTFKDALGAKATIGLGAGNDTLTLVQGTPLTTGSTFNGGDGTDTLVLNTTTTAIDSTSGKMFSGFENVKLAGTTSSYHVGDISGVTGYELATTTAGNLTNLSNSTSVKISLGGVKDTLTLADNSSATSSVSVSLNNGASVAANGVSTVLDTNAHVLNVASDGLVNATHNAISLTGATSSLAQITNIVLSGSQALDLTTAAATALTLIDGSSATGALTINSLTATKAMTIKGGSAADTITATDVANANATIVGGKGADTIALGATATNNVGDVINIATAGDSTITAYDNVLNFSTAAAATADILKMGSTTVMTSGMGSGWTVATGFATKGGATLSDFIAAFSTSTTAGVVAFTVGTNSYVGYSDGNASATDDVLVQLVGVNTATAVATTAAAKTIVIA